MKICSLLPSATEILFALGLGEAVVGVSHECDFPPEARRKPRVIESVIDQNAWSSDAVDQIVVDHLRRKQSLYRIDLNRLRDLKPDLIVTQELCEVCAIDASEVTRAIGSLSHRPAIVSLHPHTLSEMLDDIVRLGEGTGRAGEASRVVDSLKTRLERIRYLVAEAPLKPRVFCMEWLKPPMASGHWVPEMVGVAGGIEVIGRTGEPSRYVEWERVVAAQPEALILMPCGFPIERTKREVAAVRALAGWEKLPAVQQQRVYLVNGPAYYNRSGPRLVDGVEIFAELWHPDRCRGLIPPGAVERLEDG